MEFKLRILILPLLAFLVLMQSCNSSPMSGSVHMISAYLPYVESVEVTTPVQEGEHVLVTLQLSAFAKPEILQSIGHGAFPESGLAPGWIGWIDRGFSLEGVELHPWIEEPLTTGPATSELTLDIGWFVSGEYSLGVRSARVREIGGLEGAYNSGSASKDPIMHPDAVLLHTLEFEVLPVE